MGEAVEKAEEALQGLPLRRVNRVDTRAINRRRVKFRQE